MTCSTRRSRRGLSDARTLLDKFFLDTALEGRYFPLNDLPHRGAIMNQVAKARRPPPPPRLNTSYGKLPTLDQLVGFSREELREFDPLAMNLIVAKGIPRFKDLDIRRYQKTLDEWASRILSYLREAEPRFGHEVNDFQKDIRFFRIGAFCWFIGQVLDVAYKPDQKHVRTILYTDPTDLFLNGVIDTRRGTCGSMAALFLALGWRLGWPVSLATVASHFIVRYDDGKFVTTLMPAAFVTADSTLLPTNTTSKRPASHS